MTKHPKTPASSTTREADEGVKPGAQAFGISAGSPREASSGIVGEHQALVEKLGHNTAPETDLGEPAEEMPDPPEKI